MKKQKQIIDVAVVGSGPGGSTTAALLAEAGLRVILIERGRSLPLSSCTPFTIDEMTQKYHRGGVTIALGKPTIAYVEGRCAGGGSEVNSGLYHRTPDYLVREWVDQFNIENLSYSQLIPYFEENEKDLTISYVPQGLIPKASLKLHEGAQALGWNSIEVPRWYRYSTDGTGVKQSMTETFLPRALQAGAQFFPQTEVDRIYSTEQGWSLRGCTVQENDSKRFEIDSKYIFLCGGTISTASLLRRNGLSQIAGREFHLHPSIKLVARFADEVNHQCMGVPVHQVKEFSPRYSFGCSISSPPYLSLAMLDIEGGQQLVESHWRNMAIYYAMTKGGVGNVHPLPWFNEPLVRYKLDDKDIQEILEGMVDLAKCLFAAGATEIYPSVQGSRVVRNLDEIIALRHELTPAQLNLMTIHLFSSCPMGEDRSRCVVNSYGELHGHKGVYVNDGSLLPTALGVNPQGTIMALARRNVDYFLKEING